MIHRYDISHIPSGKLTLYCWWTKSCTTKDDNYPIIYRVLTIPGGAGFLPSTVAMGNPPFESMYIFPIRNPVDFPLEKYRAWPIWVVVSNIYYFHPCLGRWCNLTTIFQMGWNHQPDIDNIFFVDIYIYIWIVHSAIVHLTLFTVSFKYT